VSLSGDCLTFKPSSTKNKAEQRAKRCPANHLESRRDFIGLILSALLGFSSMKDLSMNTSYIRINQLIQTLPISKASIWRKVKQGTFPAPVKLSVGITAWRTALIETWLNQCEGVSK